MIRASGSIWDFELGPHDAMVVPTCLGHTKSGLAIMGRGIAKRVAAKCPTLIEDYGEFCCKHQALTPVVIQRFKAEPVGGMNLILFPVVPYRKDAPHLAWRSPPTLECIEQSLVQLSDLIYGGEPPLRPYSMIYIPDVGCGVRNRTKFDVAPQMPKPDEVRPLIDKYLGAFHNVIHVRYSRTI